MLAERWISFPVGVKWLIILFAGGLLYGLIEFFIVQPRQDLLREMLLEERQAEVRLMLLRKSVASLAQATRATTPSTTRDIPFSLTDLLSKNVGHLRKWLPDSKPATLEIQLAWENLPQLFLSLAAYADIKPPSFAIVPEGESLHLTLQLAVDNED